MNNVAKLQSAEINKLRQRIRLLEASLLATINLGKKLAEGDNIAQQFRMEAWQEFDKLKKAMLDE